MPMPERQPNINSKPSRLSRISNSRIARYSVRGGAMAGVAGLAIAGGGRVHADNHSPILDNNESHIQPVGNINLSNEFKLGDVTYAVTGLPQLRTVFSNQLTRSEISAKFNDLDIKMDASKRAEGFDTVSWAVEDKFKDQFGIDLKVVDPSGVITAKVLDAYSAASMNEVADGQVITLSASDKIVETVQDLHVPLNVEVQPANNVDESNNGSVVVAEHGQDQKDQQDHKNEGDDDNKDDHNENDHETKSATATVTPTATETPTEEPVTATATNTPPADCITSDVKGELNDLADSNHLTEEDISGIVSNIAKDMECSDDIYLHMYGSMQKPTGIGSNIGLNIESQRGNHILTEKIIVDENTVDKPFKRKIPKNGFCTVQVDLTRDGEIKVEPRYIDNDFLLYINEENCNSKTATPIPGRHENHKSPTPTNSPVPTHTAESSPTPQPQKPTEVPPTPVNVVSNLPNAGSGNRREVRKSTMPIFAAVGATAIGASMAAWGFLRRKNDEDEDESTSAIVQS